MAHFSSWPTVSQLESFSDSTSNWCENRRPRGTQISTIGNKPFIQNSNQIASNMSMFTTTASFPSVFFSSCNIQDNIQVFLLLQEFFDDKNWLDISSIFYMLVDFKAQFCFRCKFSFHDKQCLTKGWFPWTYHSSLLCIATNEFASKCSKNISETVSYPLTTFWHHLWSTSFKQTHNNMEFIC